MKTSKKPKQVSAGVIVTNGADLLLCHVTNARHWDIPKGKVDLGESYLDAAVRELREETGLVCDPSQLVAIGLFEYKPSKDLSLWLWRVDDMPDTDAMDCVTMFRASKGCMMKEMDAYELVGLADVGNYVVPDMLRVLTRAFEIIK